MRESNNYTVACKLNIVKVYKKPKQFSKKVSTLSKNYCKTKLRHFLNLTIIPGQNEVPLKSIHDVYKQKNNILIFLIRPSAVKSQKKHPYIFLNLEMKHQYW